MDVEEYDEFDLLAFDILSAGGTAKGMAYEALDAAEQGNFNRAEKLLVDADQHFLQAHEIQTKLLQRIAAGEHITASVMFAHAQDHLMTGMESRALIGHLIKLYQTIYRDRRDGGE